MCEFFKSCLKRDDCRSRADSDHHPAGRDLGFNDRFENLGLLRTGIWEIDAWIEQPGTWGPRRPRSLSPETPAAERAHVAAHG